MNRNQQNHHQESTFREFALLHILIRDIRFEASRRNSKYIRLKERAFRVFVSQWSNSHRNIFFLLFRVLRIIASLCLHSQWIWLLKSWKRLSLLWIIQLNCLIVILSSINTFDKMRANSKSLSFTCIAEIAYCFALCI